MIVNDDLLEIAAEIEMAVNNSDSSKVNIELMKWQAELLIYHFKGLNGNKPIGYMSLTGVENIHDCGSSTVHEESDDKRNIPVYIQY
ncbi:hypothetical protein [Providencia alcalifaciens]|uniref:hypothetical protein n=1 Tax=Providencia alcalifaciens TaxID=126385 RepID=UPI000D940D2C|nr:hypothetical protein [Providencia alcalifaciens]MTC29201.1 hypothetical protein [Providencia alcalifaciens]SPY71547.1 Uncharacterised protein [Providencia alcalifaciens]